MKFYIEREGGPSPGIRLVGSRDDLRKLSDELGASIDLMEKEGREEGELSSPSPSTIGDSSDWLCFRASTKVERKIADFEAVERKRIFLFGPIAWALGLTIIYFAYLGVKSLWS